MEIKLYDKIFDVANSMMQQHGMEFSFGREVFASFLDKDPNVIQVSEFKELEAADFVGAVYLRCLNRLPDAMAYRQLDYFNTGSEDNILYGKYLILVSVSYSAEFQELHKKLEGLKELRTEILRKCSLKIKCRLRWAEFSAENKCFIKKYFLFPIWRRLPEKSKKAIRTFLKRER